MDISKLEATTRNLEKRLEKCKWERDSLIKQLEQATADLATENSSIDIFDKSKLFLQSISESARGVAKARIEVIVTDALQYVFGQAYSFEIVIRHTNSGRPEADFLVCTNFNGRIIKSTPGLSKGGGVVDLLAIALKFSILELMNYDGFIWMDEPFKHLSKKYRPLVAKLLTFMHETSGRQIVIITHSPELAGMCDRILNIRQTNGISKVV